MSGDVAERDATRPASDEPGSGRAHDARRYRVAMLAPPWIPVPPPGYGGIEVVLSLLCEGWSGAATT